MISSLRNWNTHYDKASDARAKFYLSWIKQHSQIEGEVTLDVGCGSGFISTTIKKAEGTAISLDINYRKRMEPGLDYITADATMLPIRDNTIKNIISSDVYEHIPAQDRFLSENCRVMKPDGLSFLSTGNRFFPIDRHTGLPFIDILPKRIASAWARKAKNRPNYDVYEPDIFELRKKLLKVSDQHIVDPRMFIDFYKKVYPHLYRKGKKWFIVARFLDRLGLLKLVTPKLYAVFRKKGGNQK